MRKYSKELYEKEVLLKAAYAFTDTMYIHIDVDADNYLVELCSKQEEESNELYKKFENELIMQEVRVVVASKTKNIREMIVARALSSTIIDTNNESDIRTSDEYKDEILSDWFNKYEESIEVE